MSALKGYLHPTYLASLKSAGEPVFLPEAQGWLLRRPLPCVNEEPAISDPEHSPIDFSGPYPFFRCLNPLLLPTDLASISNAAPALVIVTDPLGPELDKDFWPSLFPDCCRLFKAHWGIDFAQPLQISSHHRYYARKAFRSLEIERVSEPQRLLKSWNTLYTHLIQRHQIQGLRRFSEQAFAQQLQVPGIVVFAAKCQAEIVAMHLWYWESELGLAYSHLAACSEVGYLHSAPYALYMAAIEWFQAQGVAQLDLGGEVSALAAQGKSGLGFFKRGWANRERPVWICGKILNAERYAQLAGKETGAYFPIYRSGESRDASRGET